MHFVAAVVADEQSLVVVEPGEGALDDPADTAEAGPVLGLAAGDLGFDAAGAQLAPVLVVVVATIGADRSGRRRGRPTLPRTGRSVRRAGSVG